jgi:hypothetical protein
MTDYEYLEDMFESDFGTNDSVYRRWYKRRISHETGICDRCPWHRGENGFDRKKRTDRYKTERKGR